MRRRRTPPRSIATVPRTRRMQALSHPQAVALRSRKRLGFDVLVLEVFQRAGMEWKIVLLVEPARRELSQVRSDADHLGLVRLHCLDGLVHHIIGHLGVGEQDVVDSIDLHRFFDADEYRSGLDVAQVAVGLNLARRGYS